VVVEKKEMGRKEGEQDRNGKDGRIPFPRNKFLVTALTLLAGFQCSNNVVSV